MTVTAQMVKELRDSTGAGMMDAKKALVENNGDIEAAGDWLREKGILKAAPVKAAPIRPPVLLAPPRLGAAGTQPPPRRHGPSRRLRLKPSG